VSSHGRPRHGPEPAGPGPAQFGWAVLVLAAALIGGLAAATLVHASVVIAVIVSVVVGGVALLAAFRLPSRSSELEAGQRADPGRYPVAARRHAPAGPQAGRRLDPTVPQAVAPPAAFAAHVPDPLAPASADPVAPASADPVAPASAAPGRPERDGQARETVVQLLPLPPEPGRPGPPDAPWWDSAQGAPSPSPGARRAPAPDLSTYLAATFIAQCPRCGAFRLDIHRAADDWNFRCESCDYTWTWQPGTPWPPVRVRPRERPPAP
jgi:hypothetical protein